MASRFYSLVFIELTGLFGLSLPLDLPVVTAQVQTVQDHKAEADKLIDLGDQQIDKSQYQQALRSYQSALNLYRLINNPKGKAIALFKLGYSGSVSELL